MDALLVGGVKVPELVAVKVSLLALRKYASPLLLCLP